MPSRRVRAPLRVEKKLTSTPNDAGYVEESHARVASSSLFRFSHAARISALWRLRAGGVPRPVEPG